jgi:hypothetical protein
VESGISRADLQAAIDLIAAVNAGVVQAIANRGWAQLEEARSAGATEAAAGEAEKEEVCSTCSPAGVTVSP